MKNNESAPKKTAAYEALEKKFRAQVEKDMKDHPELIVSGRYISNPYLSQNPKYVLIALEPSIPKISFKNETEFLGSIRNFLLHYCAFHFLCGGKFDYYLTDISKSAMMSNNANKNGVRKVIYPNWLALLREEIEVLSDKQTARTPEIISIGKTVMGFLERFNPPFSVSHNIYHYGSNNNGRFKTYFEGNVKEAPIEFDELIEKVEAFAKDLMSYLGFSKDEIDERINFVFKARHHSQMQFVYRYCFLKDEFTKIRAGHH